MDEDWHGFLGRSGVGSVQFKDENAIFVSWKDWGKVAFSCYPAIIFDNVSDVAAIAAKQEGPVYFAFFLGQNGNNFFIILCQFKQFILLWPLYH